MFLWVTLPESGLISRQLLDLALKDKVIFVPGRTPSMSTGKHEHPTPEFFPATDEETIDTGIRTSGKSDETIAEAGIIMQ